MIVQTQLLHRTRKLRAPVFAALVVAGLVSALSPGQGELTFTNKGTVNANTSGQTLIVQPGSGGLNNTGTLTVARGATPEISGAAGTLLNYNNSTLTLTGGIFSVTGTLQLSTNNARANTIATDDANITLTGTSSQIRYSQPGKSGNALAGFLTNGAKGSFTLAGNQIFTTTGSFNNAGGLKISKDSTFTVGAGGSFNQAGGKLTVNGVLAFSTTANFASGDAFYPAAGSVNIQKGSVFGNGGMLGANVKSSGSVTPGDLATTPGVLGVSGAYTQTSAGSLNADISGTIAGSQYGQLRVSS
ncbi:MAG TPA: hypothetical protein VL523_10120, partial [Terriglobia bacterium]|nr:hypothetical protein [Terriglobia bacterium]